MSVPGCSAPAPAARKASKASAAQAAQHELHVERAAVAQLRGVNERARTVMSGLLAARLPDNVHTDEAVAELVRQLNIERHNAGLARQAQLDREAAASAAAVAAAATAGGDAACSNTGAVTYGCSLPGADSNEGMSWCVC